MNPAPPVTNTRMAGSSHTALEPTRAGTRGLDSATVLGPSPEALFDARLKNDPGSPLVTFYDDATGERAELSAKSLGNWVAKTYSLLSDSLGLGPGDTAQLRLPVH